jgi:acetyl esterase/lipase
VKPSSAIPKVGAALAVLLTSGCCHLSYRSNPGGSLPLPREVAAEFAYSNSANIACSETVRSRERSYVRKQIELHITEVPGDANRTIGFEYYDLPGTNRSPVIIFLPIMGGSYSLEEHFAKYFARRGFACLIVHRQKLGRENILEQINPFLKQTVLDNKRIIDWIETQPDLDASRIGVFGTSMGGIKAALLVPLDRRVRAAVFGLAGGDLPYIMAHTTERGVARRRKAVLAEQKISPEELEKKLRGTITCDPIAYAPYVDPQSVLLVLAVFDSVVPAKKGRELRNALGKPETIFLPAGHYSALLFIPYLKWASCHFFEKRLE